MNQNQELSVFVGDFVSTNSVDAVSGIRAAVKRAMAIGARKIVFEPGTYCLHTSSCLGKTSKEDPIIGRKGWEERQCHLLIERFSGLTLQGAVDASGNPATELVGFNDGINNGLLPSILWIEDCQQLTLENLTFTRNPEYASAGEVVAVEGDTVQVEVFEGNPCYDGMGTYCLNRIDPCSGALLGNSVTFGEGADNSWKLLGGRRLELHDSKVASQVNTGEYLSWHQGAKTDFQVYIGRCRDVQLSNIRTCNSNGFCLITEGCEDVRADRVVFKPRGNQLFTGPRDAWKIGKCSGHFEISGMAVEGVRMDGQNMHSNWMVLEQIGRASCRERVSFTV